ncbi:hypothetical protein KM043_014039 [Ampulex compressa]|nr:hypothetical protein KM043_014039 [Ampulex compressa]
MRSYRILGSNLTIHCLLALGISTWAKDSEGKFEDLSKNTDASFRISNESSNSTGENIEGLDKSLEGAHEYRRINDSWMKYDELIKNNEKAIEEVDDTSSRLDRSIGYAESLSRVEEPSQGKVDYIRDIEVFKEVEDTAERANDSSKQPTESFEGIENSTRNINESSKKGDESFKRTGKLLKKVDESSAKQDTVGFEDASGQEEYSLIGATKLEILPGPYGKLSSPIVFDKDPTNDTAYFRPSVHLGEITESRVRTNPFNNLHHVKFENAVQLEARPEQNHDFLQSLHQVQPFQDDFGHAIYQGAVQDDAQAMHVAQEESKRPVSHVRFQDEAAYVVENPVIKFHGVLQDQRLPIEASIRPQYEFVDQQIFQNLERPIYEPAQEPSVMQAKPSKFQGEVHGQSLPYLVAFYQQSPEHRPAAQETSHDSMRRPDNGVVYLHQQESSFTRTRKFPYQYYQPTFGYQQVQLVKDPRPVMAYPKKRRISPWRKIVHLIGAFLPLGLLLATLTPNVMQIDNSTQPNIVLSKLRVADLPVEHKQSRLLNDSSDICEERSICELIMAGGKSRSSTLQNVLWSLVARAPDVTIKENDLQEVFEAVKKKDCTSIVC